MSFSSLDQCDYQRVVVVHDDVKIVAEIDHVSSHYTRSKTVARHCV